ncbi:MAG TPA: hypothetical protein VEI01_16225 [Terriglobales bacterium]|nr:hypothetical protein [Terriglobales bacterium]
MFAAMLIKSFVLLYAQEPVCALSDNQTEFAIKAFDQLSPIFVEPRCFNCHGGTIPFKVDEPTHPENGFKVIPTPQGEEDLTATFKPCQECHGDFPGWRLAPKAMQFKGKDMVGVCMLMKQQFPSDAMAFIDHMTNDRGGVPFLDVAFAGTMGLNAEGRDRLVVTKSLPDPPRSMTRPQMLQFSKDWVEAMGGRFHDPDECGCVAMKYALRINAHATWQASIISYQFGFRAGQPPEIPLHFQDDGTFSGTTTAPADTNNSGSGSGVSCAGNRTAQISLTVKGRWPDIQTAGNVLVTRSGQPHEHIQVTLSMSQVQGQSEETCTAFGRTASSHDSISNRIPVTVELFLDPVVNLPQNFPWQVPLPGWSGEGQATIIRIK